jgi:signal transduction histidine kinase
MHNLLRRGAWVLLGVAVVVLGCAAIARAELGRLREAFETDARIVHRLISQRAVEHDAILGTLALLQPPAGADSAEQRLAALYPQILSVQRRGAGASWPTAAFERAQQESRVKRRPVLASFDFAAGRYDLVLASHPDSFAAQIDLRTAIPWTEWPMARETSPVRVRLEHAGQGFELQRGRAVGGGWRYAFRKRLAAESQPFDVVATRDIGWAELPWAWMLAWTATVTALLAGVHAWQRQRAERRRAEELLRLGQVARLNALGELAAGMAHELNQPLTAVLAGTQAAKRLLDEDPPDMATAREAMQHAADQSRRASDVLARLRRAVERPGETPAAQPVELLQAARNALYLLEPEFARRQVVAKIEDTAAPTTVLAEPVAVEQILHNLLMNAAQSLEQMPTGARSIRVLTATQSREGTLSVIDSGPGIPDDDLPHVFEPFFSTRPAGLGLGLSLCETLAQRMGGRLEAAHGSPEGAAFHLHLPLAMPA